MCIFFQTEFYQRVTLHLCASDDLREDAIEGQTNALIAFGKEMFRKLLALS